MTTAFQRRPFVGAVLAILAISIEGPRAIAQVATGTGSPSHVVIPFLANATKPSDIDFEGGECELDSSRDEMACTFQQVFLTTSGMAPDTCLVTTNRYERVFRRDGPTGWVSTEGPEGICGLLDVATLKDDGGVRWTMETRRVVTKKDASSTCQAVDTRPETFSWRNVRRTLPCRFVQPGALSR